jgi:nitrite reductase/ring-hydroxylating ferredoxin subunit
MDNAFQRVANLDEVPEGDFLVVTAPNGDSVLLTKVSARVFACSQLCTHADAWLDAGEVHPRTMEIECPLHGGAFSLETGEPTRLPPTDPIVVYQVRVDGEDVYLGSPS